MSDVPPRAPIYPPVYLLGHVALMVVLHLVVPLARWIDWPWKLLGALSLLLGAGLVVVCASLFGKKQTTIKPFEESSALVVEGPFRHSRNPIYLGMVLGLVGVATLLGSVTPLLLVPLFVVQITTRFIQKEEAMLEQRFGEAYTGYKRRVRRWL